MSEFKIKPHNVRTTAQDLNSIAKQMKNLESQILKIQKGLSFEIAQKQRIRQRLKTAGNDTATQYKKIYDSTSALNNIVNTYEVTERSLAGSKVPHFDMAVSTVLESIHDSIVIGPGSLNGNSSESISPGCLVSKLILGSSSLYTYEKEENKTKYGSYSKTLDKIKKDEITWYSLNKDDLDKSKIESVKLWDKKWSSTKSVFHEGDLAGDKENTHASYNVDVLKREATAEVYGGLYYTDPKTGERKLRMAAGASAGFTISAFSADAEAQLGNSNLGGYLKGDVEVGKAEAKAEGVAGLRDSDGKINPTLHGKVSAEAIAAEASGKIGGKVLGTDVGVKASVNVGVGAHFEAGFKDWKLSLNVGASFGVGGSVKLEIDVSGTMKALAGHAESAWNKFTSWFK